MTNEALQAMIEAFGDRLTVIKFDNTSNLYLGYNTKVKKTVKSGVDYDEGRPIFVKDLELVTIGGVDFLAVPHSYYNSLVGKVVSFKTYHVTETIQKVFIMDEDSADFVIDPLIIG